MENINKKGKIIQVLIQSCTNYEAYQWAVEHQGFAGDYENWCELPSDEREEYELGAAGIPTG